MSDRKSGESKESEKPLKKDPSLEFMSHHEAELPLRIRVSNGSASSSPKVSVHSTPRSSLALVALPDSLKLTVFDDPEPPLRIRLAKSKVFVYETQAVVIE